MVLSAPGWAPPSLRPWPPRSAPSTAPPFPPRRQRSAPSSASRARSGRRYSPSPFSTPSVRGCPASTAASPARPRWPPPTRPVSCPRWRTRSALRSGSHWALPRPRSQRRSHCRGGPPRGSGRRPCRPGTAPSRPRPGSRHHHAAPFVIMRIWSQPHQPWARAVGGLPGHVPGAQSRRTHRHCASPSPMLRQPSIPRREARSVSPLRRTGRPDDSSTWMRPLTTPTSSAPL